LEVGAYIQRMPHKPIELPPAVARRFVEDMRAFFAEKSTIEADEIAASCTQHYAGELRGTDVKEMFLQMRDQA